MARKDRKIRKKRGSRSCGGGSHKKRRGAGHRGGRGAAGTHKSKWTWVIKYDPGHFGARGFKMHGRVVRYRAINVGELNENLGRKKRGKLTIDVTKFGYGKVLGRGRVLEPMVVKAFSFSKSAVKKIEETGGKAVILNPTE